MEENLTSPQANETAAAPTAQGTATAIQARLNSPEFATERKRVKRIRGITQGVNALMMFASGIAIGYLLFSTTNSQLPAIITTILGGLGAVITALTHAAPQVSSLGSSLLTGSFSSVPVDGAVAQPPPSGPFKQRIDPLPIACILVGLLVGNIAALKAKDNRTFRLPPDKLAVYWSGTGLSRAQIEQRVFNNENPCPTTGCVDLSAPTVQQGRVGLVSEPEAEILRMTPKENLAQVMKLSSNPQVAAFANTQGVTADALASARDNFICPRSVPASPTP